MTLYEKKSVVKCKWIQNQSDDNEHIRNFPKHCFRLTIDRTVKIILIS